MSTKYLLLAVLPAVFAHGETYRTLIGSLKSRTTPEQETEYRGTPTATPAST